MIIKMLLFIIFLILIIGCEEEDDAFRFEGTVTDTSATPIQNAAVEIIFANPGWTYGPLETTETNSDGKYQLVYVVEKEYKNRACTNNIWRSHYLRASASGYIPSSEDSLRCNETVQIIDFTLEVHVINP
jgi:hypothetical protein